MSLLTRFAAILLASFVVASLDPAGAIDGSEPHQTEHGLPAYGPYLQGLAIDRYDNLYLVNEFGNEVIKFTPDGTKTIVAGGGGFVPVEDRLYRPKGIAVDRSGNLYIADSLNHRIQKVSPEGVVTTVAGGYGTGLATENELHTPSGVAVDREGNLFIAELGKHQVTKLATDGTITMVIGGRHPGSDMDQLKSPWGLAVDHSGNLYIADNQNDRVQKVAPDGTVTSVGGDFNGPSYVAVDRDGNLFVSDYSYQNGSIKKVEPDGTVTTVADYQVYTTGGRFERIKPRGIAFDSSGSLYLAESNQNSIDRLINTTPPGPRQITGPYADGTDDEASVSRLYMAVFNRQPDPEGHQYWINQIHNGTTLTDIARYFVTSYEFTNTYDQLTNAEFVDLLYLNVMTRPGDPEGVTYWNTVLNNGTDRADMTLLFSESAEFKLHTKTR